MTGSPVLTLEEVQEFIRDKPELNRLLSDQEFNPSVIKVAMDLAISAYNMMPPISLVNIVTFPSRALLMEGTLAKLYRGQAALKARNTMNYSDGGLQIPVEEQFPYYFQLAEMFEQS